MRDDVIWYKESEYVGKVGTSICLGRRDKARKQTEMLLVLYRLQSRQISQRIADTRERLQAVTREQKKLERKGITMLLVNDRKKKLQEELQTAESDLAGLGEQIFDALNLWEGLGATLEDLCNLCNRDPTQVTAELDAPELSLAEIAYVYNLDYKNPHDRGWIEDEVDAPFTHALKAYWLGIVFHTEKGRAAAHEAMKTIFTEVMENAMTLVTDADGIQRLIDKDGVEIASFDRED